MWGPVFVMEDPVDSAFLNLSAWRGPVKRGRFLNLPASIRRGHFLFQPMLYVDSGKNRVQNVSIHTAPGLPGRQAD